MVIFLQGYLIFFAKIGMYFCLKFEQAIYELKLVFLLAICRTELFITIVIKFACSLLK